MTDVEKLRFLLSSTVTVAGQIYAASLAEDGLRKMTVSDCATMRSQSISHAVTLIGDVIKVMPTLTQLSKEKF